jgi:tetratricopeptide (TPR) repeat protein
VKCKLLILSCFLLLVVPVFAQPDIAFLLKEAERLEPANQEAAFIKYKEVIKIKPAHIRALYKCSELCSSIGNRQLTKETKIDYFKAAKIYAQTALKVDAKNAEANFAMAVAMGRMALVVGGKEKIIAVNDIKKYAELSVLYDSSNFKPYHVLGKWHYEVSSLSGFERSAAKVFYGGLPAASFKESIRFYEKSKKIAPDFLLNYLELAKAYYKNNEKAKARQLLTTLLAMPVKVQDDVPIKEEAKQLQKAWK